MFYRAFSLIEIVISLAILSIILLTTIPIIQKLNSIIVLQNEVEQVRAFIYQIQSKARYQRSNYTLTLSQDNKHKKWCLIATKKSPNQIKCDCLNLNQCEAKEIFMHYNYHNDTELKSNSFYPSVFLDISGESGNSNVKCLQFSLNNQQKILKFDRGLISEYATINRSKCKDL